MEESEGSEAEQVRRPALESVMGCKSFTGFPVVGIGASAGGLAAFEAFFSGMPQEGEPGMAFVLVQHLAPNHKSLLSEIIRRYVRMEVLDVEDGIVVQPNRIYVIPPGHDMAFLNGSLQLLEPSTPRGHRMPIDFFFRSLAQDQRERAIGIILSGTGSDGTLGIRAIKGEGGMVMVQNPASTEFDGMPRTAIATGLVDYELPPAEMPGRLRSYVDHAFGKLPCEPDTIAPNLQSILKKIFVLLRAQTGHDFSMYKMNTIQRRIERRMAVNHIVETDNYLKFLQQSSREVDALFSDLLIGVTTFFRDQSAFDVLEKQVIPKLFAGKPEGSLVRVWSAGCSTGEEAYSLAILLFEHMEVVKKNYKLQVFATDINSHAIATARQGYYPASIAVDVSPTRLAQFFTSESDGSFYRIQKSIRDILIFSEQDLIRDPPFSKIDLISCRNVFIYLGPELQRKLIPLFHYAINPGGYLFLGTSSGIGEFGDLFAALDRKSKTFLRKDEFHSTRKLSPKNFSQLDPLLAAMADSATSKTSPPVKQPLGELTEQALLKQLAPIAALVNWQGDILYLHGRAGMFLEPSPGEVATNNILKMAREGLRSSLTTTLSKTVGTNETTTCLGIRVKTNGDYTLVNLTVSPVKTNQITDNESTRYLVILEEAPDTIIPEGLLRKTSDDSALLQDSQSNTSHDSTIEALKQELRAKNEYIQATHEELESINEELKSSNEEMQSVNEELQSSNEELETSKEELQSVNEELSTVNTELHSKVMDLSRANNDMNNLLSGTGVGTVFVDHQMQVLRFTPAVTNIINLILSDVGRPIAHIASNIVSYDQMIPVTQAVLNSLVPHEVEVEVKGGNWYLMRTQPYRTLDNVIEGAVITFLDITERRKAEESLRKANELARLAVVVRDSNDAITVQDLDGQTIAWNRGAEKLYGWSEAEALKMNVRNRIPEPLREEALTKLQQTSRSDIIQPVFTERIDKNGNILKVSIVSSALVNDAGAVYAIATTERQKE